MFLPLALVRRPNAFPKQETLSNYRNVGPYAAEAEDVEGQNTKAKPRQ
jgi:hypothetical protein